MKLGILNFSKSELKEIFEKNNIKKFRVDQVLIWIFRYGKTSFFDMTNVGKETQKKLDDIFYIHRPEIVNVQKSKDGTIKFLFAVSRKVSDSNKTDKKFLENCCKSFEAKSSEISPPHIFDCATELVKKSLTEETFFEKNYVTLETVYIPSEKRNTICVSSQIGCAVGCKFCNTGYNGFVRNLTPEEIVGQYLAVKDYLGLWTDSVERLSNIVYMGMGEPLYNIDNVLKSIDHLMDDPEEGVSRRKITLSTSGIVPVMKKISKDLKCKLAVSLHAPNDEIRSKIMPINDMYNIKSLMEACELYYKHHPYLKITFEYLLLNGINDSEKCARELLNLIKNLNAKVNLIRFNPWEGAEFMPSSEKKVNAFARILRSGGIESPVRERRGEDIMAACGQLKSSS